MSTRGNRGRRRPALNAQMCVPGVGNRSRSRSPHAGSTGSTRTRSAHSPQAGVRNRSRSRSPHGGSPGSARTRSAQVNGRGSHQPRATTSTGSARSRSPARSRQVSPASSRSSNVESINEEMSDNNIVDDYYSGDEILSDNNEPLSTVEGVNDAHSLDQYDLITNEYIQSNYVTEKRVEHLASPVATLLADTLNSWIVTLPSKEEIKNAFLPCLVPENVGRLLPVNINETIFNRLPTRAKETDRRLKSHANYFLRPMGPLASIWDVFIKAEAYSIRNKLQPPTLKLSDKVVPIRELTAQISSAMKLLSFAVGINLHRRKAALKPYLDPKYFTLTSAKNPITSFLFGDNLEQKVSDIYKVAQAARNPKYSTVRHNRFKQRKFTYSGHQNRQFRRTFDNQRGRRGYTRSSYNRRSRSGYTNNRRPFYNKYNNYNNQNFANKSRARFNNRNSRGRRGNNNNRI